MNTVRHISKKKKNKGDATRTWADLCSNDVTLDGFTVKERVTLAASLGYGIQTVSNYVVLDNMTKKDVCDIPMIADRGLHAVGTGGPRQLSRVTIQIASIDTVHARLTELQPVLNSYDLRAVCPTTEKAFQYACGSMDVDIISLGKEAMWSRFPFPCRHDVMHKAVARGVVFEIPYSCFLTTNSSKRQQFLSNARALVQGTRGKMIVCSSMATMGFELRRPYDVANMATFFGLSQEEAYDSVSKTALQVIKKARARKAYKGRMLVEKIPVDARSPRCKKRKSGGDAESLSLFHS